MNAVHIFKIGITKESHALLHRLASQQSLALAIYFSISSPRKACLGNMQKKIIYTTFLEKALNFSGYCNQLNCLPIQDAYRHNCETV